MSNTEIEKDCLDTLKELGFTKVVGTFDDCDGWPMIYFESELLYDIEDLKDELEDYVWDLVEKSCETDSWDFVQGRVTIDVAKRRFDFDLQGEETVTTDVHASFVVEERTEGSADE